MAGLVVAGVLVTTGCSAGPLDGLDFETTVEPDWVVEEQLIGSPSAVDGMVTSYLLDDKDLTIAVWDEETGEELWRKPVSTGAGTPGVTRSAQAFTSQGKSWVTYLRPKTGSTWQYLVVADLATGERERIVNSSIYATSPPEQCDDDETVVCVPGFLHGTTDFADLRFQIGAERVTAAEGNSDGVRADGFRMVGVHLFSTYGRGHRGEEPEQLGYIEDDEVVWHRPYTEVFDKGYSTDGGWEWADGDSTEFAIGSGSFVDSSIFDAPDGTSYTRDLTERQVVALDRGTGETRWALAGGGGCPFINLDVFGEEDNELLVACRWNAGELASTAGSDDVTYPETPDVDLLGIDPHTGREVWSVPLGNLEYTEDSESFVSDDQSLILDLDGEVQAVDLATGAIDAIPEGTYLCERAREEFIAPHPSELGKTSPFGGGDARFPCDQDGSEIKTDALSVAALTLADGEEAESVFVSGTDRMARYTVPEELTLTDRLRDLW